MMGRCDMYSHDLQFPLHHTKQQADKDDVISSLSELEVAVQKELAAIDGQPELFMRSTSDLTNMLRDIAYQHGRSYFRYALRDVFGDKTTIYTNQSISQEEVASLAESVAKRLAKAIHYAPLMLRACTQFVLREFQTAFPAYNTAEQLVVGSVLFLRVLCPALIKPETFGFQPHTVKSLPKGVQIARLLQTALRGVDSTKRLETPCIDLLHSFLTTFLKQFPQMTSAHQSLTVDVDELAFARFQSSVAWEDVGTHDVLQCTKPSQSPERVRGLSLSTRDDLVKQKKKFSLKFWR